MSDASTSNEIKALISDNWQLETTSAYVMFVLVVIISASTYLSLFVRRDPLPENSNRLGEIVIVFGVTLAAFVVARHILVLSDQPVLVFNLAINITCFLLVMAASFSGTNSLTISTILALVASLCLLIILSPSDNKFIVSISMWFNSGFPYEINLTKFSKGILTFILTSIITLHYLSLYNQKKKREILLGSNEGIDPAALEKISFAIAGLVALLATLLILGVSLPAISLATGAVVAGVGFATKDVISNIAAGLVLIWDETFKVDDVISIDGGGYGWIDKLALRHAVVKDRDDVSILIPYSKLVSSTIQNWTHDGNKVRLKIDIGVDYDADLSLAKECLLRAASRANSRVLGDPGPKVTVIAAGDSAIQLQLRFWISDPKNGIRNVMSDVLEAMIGELKRSEIRIPFTMVDVNVLAAPVLRHDRNIANQFASEYEKPVEQKIIRTKQE